MKKRLQAIYWRGILVTMVMAAVAIGAAARLKLDDTRNHLSAMLQAASRWTLDSNEDLQSLAETIAGVSPSLRVTFLMDSGLVLADSEADARPEANHYGDAEIAAARRGETGRDLRISATGSTYILYMARRIAPQLILRLGYPVLEGGVLPLFYGLGLIITFLVLYQLQRRSVARLAKDQEKQLDEVRRLLDGDTAQAVSPFPEYQPAMDEIAYRVRRLREDHREVMQTLEMRSSFVANASHELRSPLTSIRGFAEMLDEGLADTPEEQALCVRTIRGECDRMLAVIEDILRLSRAEHEAEAVHEPLSAAPVAQEIRQSLLPRADAKGIGIRVEGNASFRLSEKELWEILYNLMDNAVRYGRRGGFVRVSLSEGRMEVEDNGIGIGEEHIGHIFEQFYRVDDARSAQTGGTGLGLSIVRTIVERRGGTIRVQSRPGEGTRFLLLF